MNQRLFFFPLIQERHRTKSAVNKRACTGLSPSSASAAHAVDVLLYVTREVIIKDMRYVMDIQPSRCQVCGDQDANSTWKKIKKNTLSCGLFDP